MPPPATFFLTATGYLPVSASPKAKFVLWRMAISDDTELKFWNFINATNKATVIICCVLSIRPFFSPSVSFLLLSKLKQCLNFVRSLIFSYLKNEVWGTGSLTVLKWNDWEAHIELFPKFRAIISHGQLRVSGQTIVQGIAFRCVHDNYSIGEVTLVTSTHLLLWI